MGSLIGTRAHRIGSIYSRIKNLLNAGIIGPEAKPLWYDVYQAFPPKREPTFTAELKPDQFGLVRFEDTVKPLLYKEDWARVLIMKVHNDFSSAHNLSVNEDLPTISEIFIETYLNLQKLHPELLQEELFQKTEDALSAGIEIKK